MVNKKKVEKKLPSLLIDGEASLSDPKEWNEYLKKRQKLSTFKRNHPLQYQSLASRAVQILEEIDRALYNDLVVLDKNLADEVRQAFGKKKR